MCTTTELPSCLGPLQSTRMPSSWRLPCEPRQLLVVGAAESPAMKLRLNAPSVHMATCLRLACQHMLDRAETRACKAIFVAASNWLNGGYHLPGQIASPSTEHPKKSRKSHLEQYRCGNFFLFDVRAFSSASVAAILMLSQGLLFGPRFSLYLA